MTPIFKHVFNYPYLPEKMQLLSYDLDVRIFLKFTSNTDPPVSVTTAVVGSPVKASSKTP